VRLRAGAARSAAGREIGADLGAESTCTEPDTAFGGALILFVSLEARLTNGVEASTSTEGVAVGDDARSDASDRFWSSLPDKPYKRAAKQITPSAERERTVRILRSVFVGSGTACWIAIFDPQ
jgi:hypothetical protein